MSNNFAKAGGLTAKPGLGFMFYWVNMHIVDFY